MKRVGRVVLAGLLAVAVPVAAQKTPEKIRLTGTSTEGAVLLRVPVHPFPYALMFGKAGSSGFGSRVFMMKVDGGPPGYRYIARTLEPGRYRLNSVWQQQRWSVCLEDGTFDVEVAPARVSWIGTFNVDNLLLAIQSKASDAERTKIGAGDYFLARGAEAQPLIVDRDASGLEAARSFAERGMNGSGARVELAVMEEARFSSSSFSRFAKICG